MSALALDQNLALSAGAGTGKTHALMTIALHLLAGARREGTPLPPGQLCIVTFTEKAAAQLQARLRARVDGLCHEGSARAEEPELLASFEALGRRAPDAAFWRGIRRGLETAQIGTFHGLALRWLGRLTRRGEAEASQLLDEDTARTLLRESVERTVIARLDAQDREVAHLCRDLGFSGPGWAGGLVDTLIGLIETTREEGTSPLSWTVGDEAPAREAFEGHLARLRAWVREARMGEVPRRFEEPLAALEDALTACGLEGFEGTYPALERIARAGLNLSGVRNEVLKRVKHGVVGDRPSRTPGLADLYAGWANVPLERCLRGLAAEAVDHYRATLQRRGLLDFAELLTRVRDVWRDRPAARRAAQARVGALLVDEFQDTNRVQLELVTLLAEQREGGPRPVGSEPGAVLALPLEPAFLAIVGDRKQSIYEFRGADVSLFEVLARRMDDAGGARAFLKRSHRATPPLVEVLNQGFARWMAPLPDARDYEVGFGPDDSLVAIRPAAARPALETGADGPSPAPPLRVLQAPQAPAEGALAAREAEARALAVELRRILASGQVRGGEVAVLLRRFTWVEVFRQALIQAGVPHQVWRGRGFFAAPEVRDLESLLAFLCDPEDHTSLAALLRSPFVGVSDASLFALSRACGTTATRAGLRKLDLGALLVPPEAERLGRFLALEERWRADRDRTRARDLLQEALEATGYLTAAAAGPHGEQVLANLGKLLERAERGAGEAAGDVARFAVELRRLVAEPTREAQAELQDGVDPDAVQLLTVHQAKGLEWPIVVVAELGAPRFKRSARFIYERNRGLALRCVRAGAEAATSPRFREVSEEQDRREEAEEVRLFYVALSRARDGLVLSGLPPERDGSGRTGERAARGWAACVAGLSAPALAALREEIPWTSPPPPRPPLPALATPDPALAETLEAHIARVRAPPSPRTGRRTLSLGAWADAADCPRRYWLKHVQGIGSPAEATGAAESTTFRAAAIAGAAGDGIQVSGALDEAWETADSRQAGGTATVEALSLRAAALAHRFFADAFRARLPEDWTVAIEVRATRQGVVVSSHDPALTEIDAELTAARIHAAHRAPPRTLAPAACQALGCEFFGQCHPGSRP